MVCRHAVCALLAFFVLFTTSWLRAQDKSTEPVPPQTSTGRVPVRKTPQKPNDDQAQGSGTAAADSERVDPKLPDAPSETTRLTAHQKFETFLKRTYSPYTFASAAVSATWAQMWGDWYSYGGGMQGWGKRYGASLANVEIRSGLSSFVLPVIFKQDPRYHPSLKKGLIPRAWYAGTRVLQTNSDDGQLMFNYSEVLGVLFTSSIQNSYYPTRDRGFSETMQRFVGGIGSDATSNLLREFTPEIKRAARKIIPKRAQKLEKKIPDPVKTLGTEVAR